MDVRWTLIQRCVSAAICFSFESPSPFRFVETYAIPVENPGAVPNFNPASKTRSELKQMVLIGEIILCARTRPDEADKPITCGGSSNNARRRRRSVEDTGSKNLL